ncbi:hypothetical protein CEXT_113131 [Caerostris extrusa]|uniref:Uncharacterized protein n=1 Tax=Caerostris extrusa TaxID=172846 RepID=A0AAV4SJL5_CAEEX|nr:hypothetical protein CEXT_113131 [Caerostris extrusa]
MVMWTPVKRELSFLSDGSAKSFPFKVRVFEATSVMQKFSSTCRAFERVAESIYTCFCEYSNKLPVTPWRNRSNVLGEHWNKRLQEGEAYFKVFRKTPFSSGNP